VFKESVSPNDINQGALGNCYFLSALSSLAEFHQNIENRFETKQINAAGIYLLTFYVNGVLTPVVVDDWIPVTRSKKPAFASTKDEELWVILLEKAWSKLHYTYARTEGGLPSFAVQHLLGTPSESFYHEEMAKDVDKFWKNLNMYDKREYIMMAAS